MRIVAGWIDTVLDAGLKGDLEGVSRKVRRKEIRSMWRAVPAAELGAWRLFRDGELLRWWCGAGGRVCEDGLYLHGVGGR